MTKEEAEREIEEIRKVRGDSEQAHIDEDEFREKFIEAVANGAYRSIEEAADVARVVLKTSEIKFSRWYA